MPLNHSIFHTLFDAKRFPQIPSIGWVYSGTTSERGSDSTVPTARMITDDTGQVMVLMTHNTDISDSWEREGEDASYFYAFSPKGYALGINVLLYAMTH